MRKIFFLNASPKAVKGMFRVFGEQNVTALLNPYNGKVTVTINIPLKGTI